MYFRRSHLLLLICAPPSHCTVSSQASNLTAINSNVNSSTALTCGGGASVVSGSSQVYLCSAFQQQGTQSDVHEKKHYNDTENQTQKNKSNDINNPWEFTGKSWF
ncbi:hypothetical protein CHARACLAT_022127 [Characodon lateralis]|uniref:Secreted protein n=1 Tax=Characodon lateralis TaxID=208331 RepID=A0ABU7EC20_9TELE|nr:hypothetical protein [Characodon lateralis]